MEKVTITLPTLRSFLKTHHSIQGTWQRHGVSATDLSSTRAPSFFMRRNSPS